MCCFVNINIANCRLFVQCDEISIISKENSKKGLKLYHLYGIVI